MDRACAAPISSVPSAPGSTPATFDAPACPSRQTTGALPSPPLYHYVIVREDIPVGMQLAQATHAAGESSGRVPCGTHAVVLGIRGEPQLRAVHERAVASGVPCVLIEEVDGSAMAIGFEPTRDRTVLRRLTSALPLAGKEAAK